MRRSKIEVERSHTTFEGLLTVAIATVDDLLQAEKRLG